MEKRMKKLLALIFAGTLCLCAFTGCSKSSDDAQVVSENENDDADDAAEEYEDTDQENDTVDAEVADDDAESSDDSETPDSKEDSDDSESEDDDSDAAKSDFCYSGEDVDGNPIKTADLFAKNKVTVVNIWASWCGPCVGEIPELEKMNSELKEKGCGVIGFLADGEDPEGLSDAKDTLKDLGVTYTNVVFPESIQEKIGLTAYPTTYFVNSKGEVMSDPVVGADPDSYSEIVNLILSDS